MTYVINSLVHKDWDLLLLQELYIDKFGNTKATSKWHTLYLSSHLTDNTLNRSVILVNAALDTSTWAQVPLEGSNNVTIIRFQLPQGQITIFNIYNDCTHSDTLMSGFVPIFVRLSPSSSSRPHLHPAGPPTSSGLSSWTHRTLPASVLLSSWTLICSLSITGHSSMCYLHPPSIYVSIPGPRS